MFGSNNDRIKELEFTVSQINLQLKEILPIITKFIGKVNDHEEFLVNHKKSIDAIISSIKYIDRKTIGDIRKNINDIKDDIAVNQKDITELAESVKDLAVRINLVDLTGYAKKLEKDLKSDRFIF